MAQIITTKSWGRRLVDSIVGIFVGIGLVIGAFVLLFWNEGNGLHTAQSLQQAMKVVVTVPDSPIDAIHDRHVIYFTGKATTQDVLHDKKFGVAENAIMLQRTVEMYQWKEKQETRTESEFGGSERQVTTYTYQLVWSPDLIDSRGFQEATQHQNPAQMPIQSKQQYADKVTVGDFILPTSLVKQMTGAKMVELKNADTEALAKEFNKPVKLTEDKLYIGESASTPKVGDLRVSMSAIYPQEVSVIAEQFGQTLQPYLAPAGKEVNLLEMGTVSPQSMIDDALYENAVWMWVLRATALLLMIVGLALIMQPVVVLADIVPFLGTLAGLGTG